MERKIIELIERKNPSQSKTVVKLEDLLRRAYHGNVTGIAAVALYTKLEYDFHIEGVASQHPELVIGILTRMGHRISHSLEH